MARTRLSLSRQRLLAEAAALNFRPDMLEKAVRLLSLLGAIGRHPLLSGSVALKGGTALNLFYFDVPRLSVDIDLNFVGVEDRAAMVAQRPEIEAAIELVARAERLAVTRSPDEFAGGKWRMRYESALGQSGNLALDLNFMARVPLWPIAARDSRPLGSFLAHAIPLIDLHEIAAGKLVALFARRASRDLFDSHAILGRADLDPQWLRAAFVTMGAMSRTDWRTVTAASVEFDPRELWDQLAPVVGGSMPQGRRDFTQWATQLVAETRARLALILPFTEPELEFLDRLLDHGEIRPGLLTGDPELADRLGRQPQLAWNAQHVTRHFGR